MTKRELAAFVLKLLGVYAIIRSLPFLQHLGAALGGAGYGSEQVHSQAWMHVSMSIPFALTAAAGILLLTCSRGLASIIVKQDRDAKLSASLRSEEIQAIGFSVVAVLVFLLALSQLAHVIGYLWFISSVRRSSGAMLHFGMDVWQAGLSFAVQCGLAVALFFRARGLAKLWHRIQVGRYVRVDSGDQNAPDESQTPHA